MDQRYPTEVRNPAPAIEAIIGGTEAWRTRVAKAQQALREFPGYCISGLRFHPLLSNADSDLSDVPDVEGPKTTGPGKARQARTEKKR